jgi:hypothetical protein
MFFTSPKLSKFSPDSSNAHATLGEVEMKNTVTIWIYLMVTNQTNDYIHNANSYRKVKGIVCCLVLHNAPMSVQSVRQ